MRLRRFAVLLIVAVGVGVGAVARAHAEGGTPAPPAPAPAPAAAPGHEAPAGAAGRDGGPAVAPLTQEELERRILKHPWLAAFKWLPLLFGLGFLAWLGWTRRGTGLRIAPPPDHGSAFRPLALPQALGLVLIVYVFAIFVHQMVVLAFPWLRQGIVLQFAVAALALLPTAGVVLWRRHVAGAGRDVPAGRAVGSGVVAFCIGSALALPLAIAAAAVMHELGQAPELQEPVRQALDPTRPYQLWITVVFGVFIAPITEESVFRGLLYPAVRDAAGGRRRGFWVGVIVVSALFAAIHANLAAALPLLGLALVLTIVFEYTNSLVPGMVAHALFNASSMLPLVLLRYLESGG